jgi:hypothetical protein
MLDALLLLLTEGQRGALAQQDPARALAISEAVEAVERAKERASGNASPQLLAAALIPPLAAVADR